MDCDFKKVGLEDRSVIAPYMEDYECRSCELTFGNIFLWGREYPMEFGIVENCLVYRPVKRPGCYCFPIGAEEDRKRALEILQAHCEEIGEEFEMALVTPEEFALLDAWFPGKFQISYNRDGADYVYEAESLKTLAGKKLHGKRNHINRFLRDNPDWCYEPIDDSNMEDCFQMGEVWRRENGCEDDPEKNVEMTVSLNALRLMKELSFTGGLLRVNGRVVAFAIGEPVTKDTFVVHIEKALGDVPGAYPMINQQFAIHGCAGYRYINRENDMGAEGLRKSKLSYQPAFLVEKGHVTRT